MKGQSGAGAKGPPKQPLPPAQGKHDWSHVLIPRGAQLMDAIEGVKGSAPAYSAALAFPASGVKQASPNHYAEAWGIEAARAAYARRMATTSLGIDQAVADFQAAKRVILDAYVPRELGPGPLHVGLWASEQGCPSSHDGQHLNGVSFARLAAWLSKDPELLAATEEILLANVRALLCVATPGLDVWQAGMRAPGKPVSACASAWLKMACGITGPHLADLRDQFYLQTRVLYYLRRQKDPLLAKTAKMTDADAAPCTLKHRMLVYDCPGGHVSVIPDPVPGAKDVCSWVRVVGGRVDFSTDWADPAPVAGLPLKHAFPDNAK